MENIEKIREVALLFLNSNVNETDIPIIASHPFTNSWIVGNYKKGGFYNLQNLNERVAWKAEMAEMISVSSLDRIVMLMNKPFVLMFISYIRDYIDNKKLAELLKDNWTRIEYISNDSSIAAEELISWFKVAEKSSLMEECEIEKFDSLPNVVKIYRGVTDHNKKDKKALSWTLNKGVAEWFAHRFGTPGEVWEREVTRDKILCYFNGGEEEEVVVDLY